MNYYLAILVAIIANMVLGFIWYGPLFGQLFMKACGISEKEIAKMKAEKQGMGKKEFATIILGALAQSAVLATVLAWYQPTSWMIGAMVGSLLWLGFTLPALAYTVVFEKHSTTLFRIDSMYQLVALSIMGAILTVLI